MEGRNFGRQFLFHPQRKRIRERVVTFFCEKKVEKG
jgi:hypothetical protein